MVDQLFLCEAYLNVLANIVPTYPETGLVCFVQTCPVDVAGQAWLISFPPLSRAQQVFHLWFANEMS